MLGADAAPDGPDAGVLLGEWPSRRAWLGLIVAMLGLLYLIAKGQLGLLLGLDCAQGDLLMLLATLDWALYSLLLRRWQGYFQLPPLVLLCWLSGAAALIGWCRCVGCLYMVVCAGGRRAGMALAGCGQRLAAAGRLGAGSLGAATGTAGAAGTAGSAAAAAQGLPGGAGQAMRARRHGDGPA